MIFSPGYISCLKDSIHLKIEEIRAIDGGTIWIGARASPQHSTRIGKSEGRYTSTAINANSPSSTLIVSFSSWIFIPRVILKTRSFCRRSICLGLHDHPWHGDRSRMEVWMDFHEMFVSPPAVLAIRRFSWPYSVSSVQLKCGGICISDLFLQQKIFRKTLLPSNASKYIKHWGVRLLYKILIFNVEWLYIRDYAIWDPSVRTYVWSFRRNRTS